MNMFDSAIASPKGSGFIQDSEFFVESEAECRKLACKFVAFIENRREFDAELRQRLTRIKYESETSRSASRQQFKNHKSEMIVQNLLQ